MEQQTELQRNLLGLGVYYLGFGFDWYMDESGFQLRHVFNQQFELVSLPSDLHSELENDLYDHKFLFDGKPIDIESQFYGRHLLLDVTLNQLYLAGEKRSCDSLDNNYNCVPPTELIEAATTNEHQKLISFAQHPDECMRYHALKNPTFPPKLRFAMMGDLSPLVALEAREYASKKYGILEDLYLLQAL